MKPRSRSLELPLSRWIRRLFTLALTRLRTFLQAGRPPRAPWRPSPTLADERAIRRVAEAQSGGLSSRDSRARYLRGENPGGLHHKAVRRDGPEQPRHHLDEPPERKETAPGGIRHLPVMRRGS